MSDCRFGVSPVNYSDPDPEHLKFANSFLSSKGISNEIYLKSVISTSKSDLKHL